MAICGFDWPVPSDRYRYRYWNTEFPTWRRHEQLVLACPQTACWYPRNPRNQASLLLAN